jgi:hypothetical protein
MTKTTEELKQDYLYADASAHVAATASYNANTNDAEFAFYIADAAAEASDNAYKLWQDSLKKEKS